MILGDICTRGCRFCSVNTGKPTMAPISFAQEAQEVARAAKTLKLKHVVVTSVARDDLIDGGALGFGLTIEALRQTIAGVVVEVLVPDFRGKSEALQTVLSYKPDVFNHNLETVPRLYRRVRPGSNYTRSLEVLGSAKELRAETVTKTGIMLGLGENPAEVLALMQDARHYGVESFTAGQYMQPTRGHLEVEEYVAPEQFEEYRLAAIDFGFKYVSVGPLVRSSYHAEEQIKSGQGSGSAMTM